MTVSSITSSFSSYTQKVTGGSSSGKQSAGAAALQEASETQAQTAKEARNGDSVAIQKLARLQQQQAEAGTSEPGKGQVVDKKV